MRSYREKGMALQFTKGPTDRPVETGGIMKERGFTFVEILIVVAIIGVLLIVAYPNIKNSLEMRNLENEAREILTTLQQAKFQSVKTKLNHRVTFENTSGFWVYYLEREVQYNVWQEVPGFVRRSIPSKYTVTVNLPSQQIVYSPLGMVLNYNTAQNSIALQSQDIQRQGQPGTRTITAFAGGSVHYVKSS